MLLVLPKRKRLLKKLVVRESGIIQCDCTDMKFCKIVRLRVIYRYGFLYHANSKPRLFLSATI